MNFMFVRVLKTEVVEGLGFLQFLLRVLEVSLEASFQSFRILGAPPRVAEGVFAVFQILQRVWGFGYYGGL